tara:strand:+ start:243 stop:923 length:681 start_codon:yes stop_codon:yes gene_type:complete
MNTIIGISGVAGSGKDTFYDLLSQRMPCHKYSLADELKKEVNQWCRMHYGIDSVECSRDQKEIIRPFLVFHGTTKRHNTNGRHWIEKLNDKLIKDPVSGLKIITDIRYDDYENDEVSWLKNELNGTLVHVSQFEYRRRETYISQEEMANGNQGTLVKKFKDPVNSEEARNDPKIKEKSDYEIEWEFIKNGQIDELNCYIDDFIKWLYLHVEARRHYVDKQNQEGRL